LMTLRHVKVRPAAMIEAGPRITRAAARRLDRAPRLPRAGAAEHHAPAHPWERAGRRSRDRSRQRTGAARTCDRRGLHRPVPAGKRLAQR
jgi:hypothetical protein